MKPVLFNKDNTCPKCAGKASYRWCGCPLYPLSYTEGNTTWYGHIHRTCVNCGFEWSEMPLDSDDILEEKNL